MNQHDKVLAELDRQIDLLSCDVLNKVPNLNLINLPPSNVPTPANEINGILSALENCQLKIQDLEKDKSESANTINQLKQELISARQMLFYKQSSGTANTASPNEPLEKLKKIKTSWIQDARNEVQELRERVELEKRKQSIRKSKEYLDDDGILDCDLDSEFGKETRSSQGQDLNSIQQDTIDYTKSPLHFNQIIEPPSRALVRSPAHSPIRSNPGYQPLLLLDILNIDFIEYDCSANLQNRSTGSTVNKGLVEQEVDQLKKEILSTRKKLSVKAPKPPAWKNVQGRPKSCNVSSTKTKSHSSTIKKKAAVTLERDLPFVVGQNTGKSYSVTANVQKVYSLLKSHNPSTCSVCNNKGCDSKCNASVSSRNSNSKTVKRIPSLPKEKASSDSSLNVLQTNLASLECEFKSLKSEYDVLVTKYDNALRLPQKSSSSLRGIGNDLKHVIQSMETKADQISILKHILNTAKSSKRSSEPKPKMENVKRPTSPTKTIESLGLLKSSRMAQNTLSAGI